MPTRMSAGIHVGVGKYPVLLLLSGVAKKQFNQLHKFVYALGFHPCSGQYN